MRAGGRGAEAFGWLLCRTGSLLLALPVGSVIEIMRSLPIEPLTGVPQAVLGVSIIRGEPIPVIDASRLLRGAETRTERLVTIAVGGRPAALAVEQVIGVRVFDPETLGKLPPLLQHSAEEAVTAIRGLDGELLLFLDAARLVPAELFKALDAAEAAA